MSYPSWSLEVSEDLLRCSVEGEEIWQLPLRSIRVIAEYTNEAGLWLDDWFLVFGFQRDDGAFSCECPVSKQIDRGMEQLGTHLDSKLKLKLFNSTTYRSRVLWPLSLRDQPFFLPAEIPPPPFPALFRSPKPDWHTSEEVLRAILD